MFPDCLFCKIIKDEVPAHKVYEDDNFLAFLDIFPISPGHTLVIPKVGQQFIGDLDDALAGGLMLVGQKVSQAIRTSNPDCLDINFYLSDGPGAGQEIPHIHLHVIPRFKGDTLGLKHGPRLQADQADLAVLAKKIENFI